MTECWFGSFDFCAIDSYRLSFTSCYHAFYLQSGRVDYKVFRFCHAVERSISNCPKNTKQQNLVQYFLLISSIQLKMAILEKTSSPNERTIVTYNAKY